MSALLALDDDSLVLVTPIVKNVNGDLIGKGTSVEIKLSDLKANLTTVAWNSITAKPGTYAPIVGASAAEALAGDTAILSAGAISAIAGLTTGTAATVDDVITALQTA